MKNWITRNRLHILTALAVLSLGLGSLTQGVFGQGSNPILWLRAQGICLGGCSGSNGAPTAGRLLDIAQGKAYIDSTGAPTFSGAATFSGAGSFGGNVTAPTGSFSTSVLAPTGSFSTNVLAPTGSFSTNVLAPTGSFSTNVLAPTVSATGSVNGALLNATGSMLAPLFSGAQGVFPTSITAAKSFTSTDCASAGGTCGSAAAGSVTIATSATTVTVATTAVGANSEILVFEDSTLGTKLSVTCNTTIGRTYVITTRTANTSFVITSSAAPTSNPACLNYRIYN